MKNLVITIVLALIINVLLIFVIADSVFLPYLFYRNAFWFIVSFFIARSLLRRFYWKTTAPAAPKDDAKTDAKTDATAPAAA